MYKLSFSPASPYVRKVRMAAFKAGMDKKLELITANTQDEKDDIRNLNPLGKIPIVTKPDGSSLFDSRVIIDHFNRVGGGLIPDNGDDRDTVLTRAALVEGLIDASLLIVYSDRYAGGETPSKVWADLQKGKIDRTLDFLENESYRIVGNLPYNISTQIILMFTDSVSYTHLTLPTTPYV